VSEQAAKIICPCGCNRDFEVTNNSRKTYFSEKCRKAAESQRARDRGTPSTVTPTDKVIAARGHRRCTRCGADDDGTRWAFWYDERDRENVRPGHPVLCAKCWHRVNTWLKQSRDADCILDPHDSPPTNVEGEELRAGIIDRSSHRPLLKGETGQLYCRVCDKLLGLVLDREYYGNHPVSERRVRCDHCLYHGATSLTKLTEALPILQGVKLPKPAPTPTFSRSLKWTFVYDDDGKIVAATCEEIELAKAA
jgi:hypothetical protein